MNILSITSLLPIPGVDNSNDFLIPLYKNLKKLFPSSNVYFIRSNKYNPFNKESLRIVRLKQYQTGEFPVKIYPYLSTYRFQNIHLILAFTLFYLNKKSIAKFLKKLIIVIFGLKN